MVDQFVSQSQELIQCQKRHSLQSQHGDLQRYTRVLDMRSVTNRHRCECNRFVALEQPSYNRNEEAVLLSPYVKYAVEKYGIMHNVRIEKTMQRI